MKKKIVAMGPDQTKLDLVLEPACVLSTCNKSHVIMHNQKCY